MCQAIRCLVVVVHGHCGVRGGRAGLLWLGEWVVVVVVVVVVVQGVVVLVLLWVRAQDPLAIWWDGGRMQRLNCRQLLLATVSHCTTTIAYCLHVTVHCIRWSPSFPPLCVQWAAT